MLHVYEKVPSKMATIMVTFDGGARAEGDTYSLGTAHMLEHMLFKGTDKRDCYSLPREIALLGGSPNAFTSNEMVSYYLSVPYENLEAAMEILSDMVWNSTLPEEEFQKEREVVLEEEAEGAADINSYLWDCFSDNFFSNRNRYPVIGYEETIKKFTTKELRKFYKKFYTKSNAIVALSSCINKREAKRLMTKYFGKSTGKVKHDVPLYPTEYKERRTVELTRPVIEHAYVWMCSPGRVYGAPNEAADSIMLSILGGGMDSRLFETIRERNGLCYGVSAGNVSFRDQASTIISSSTREENVGKLINLINIEIDKMKQDLITDEELLRSKNKFRAQTYSICENTSSAVRWNTRRAFFGGSSLDVIAEDVASLTREDIREAAQRYFDETKEMLMIIRPEKK